MIIRDIKVNELTEFINSELYRGSHTVPITPERIRSQVNNPRADPDDIVLIVAYTDEGQLAGFVGMLPDIAYSEDGPYRFAWNSGWWTDPRLGKGVVLKLFYRSIQVWKGFYMITDLTAHTRRIVAFTRLFECTPSSKGIRLQLLSDVSGKLDRKYSQTRPFLHTASLMDKTVNLIRQSRLKEWKRKNAVKELHIEYLDKFDNDCLSYIEQHNFNDLCRRGKTEFEWIRSYPWLSKEKTTIHDAVYPFSWNCRFFKFFYAKVIYRGKIAGIVLLTNREGFYKIPYVYYESSQFSLFAYAVCKILIDRQAVGFCTFHGNLIEYIRNSHFPFLYKKTILHELAFCKTLSHKQPDKFSLQDGDGDVVFT
ncbi:MAG: hypothetical protein JW973_06860 [Bacteroidales bacterium]|nr:hypothetical protein [Bacteroidales bacterium]